MSTHAIVTVKLRIHCDQPWSDDEKLSVIRKSAGRAATENVMRACEKSNGRFAIVGDVVVESVQTVTPNKE